MDKLIFRSESDRTNASESFCESVWYTVVDEHEELEAQGNVNPWNQDCAVIKKTLYLMDDCVIVIRPARSNDKIEITRDYDMGYYFIEIMNQDGSEKYSSHKIYKWDEVIEKAYLFKGLSFSAASRVWKVKKM